jgi:FKBP-type peptidyl-prolyl cis-trans isomerase (trigger factor)
MATKTTHKATDSKAETIILDAKLSWLPKKTFELEITIPTSLVASTYTEVLTEMAKNTTVKGFRKGKAPKEMAEKQIGKENVYEEVVQHLVSQTYFEAVKQHNLHPIVNPKVTPVSMQEGKDWVVKATACEIPEVKLGDYKQAVKGLKATSKIWTPDKANQADENKDKAETVKLDQIFDELLKQATIEIPDLLIESEANRLLSQLVDQVNAVGMTVQQYLDSKGKTQEQLRAEYAQAAIKTLKMEFILAKIAEEEKIAVMDKEIDDIISKTQDPYAKKSFESPDQRNYLALIIRKQKTVDFLNSL